MTTPHRFLKALLVALALCALAVGGAFAQDKKANEYPNATRKEPKQFRISEKASKQINAAYEHLDAGEMDKAKAILDGIVAGKSSDYEKALAYQGLAQVKYDADDVAGAIALNEQAIAANALDNKSHFNLVFQTAQMNLMDEKYDAALAAVDRWFQLTGSQTAEAWSLKGNALYRLDRFPEASEALKKAIELSPKPNASYNELLIASYYDAENFAEAARAAEALLAKNPTDKKLVQQLSSIYVELEQEDKALAVLEAANAKGLLTEEKDLRQLYQMYNYAEKPTEAARVITEGIAKGVLKPSAETYKGLGDAYALNAEAAPEDSAQHKELTRKAADAYGEAAKLTTDNGEMDMQRGHLLIEIEAWADAKAALTTAFQKRGLKREGEAYILLGTAEMELGNDAAAIAAYEKAKAFPNTKSMAEAWLKSVRQQ